MRKARILVATALAIAASAAAAAREPSMREPARLEAELGFDGHFVPDRWAPLWLRSEGAPGARIEVERRGANGSDIGRESFPAGDGQRIECPVPMTVDLETIAVRLVSGDGILAEVKLDARSNAFPGNLALACGLPVSARLAISSALMPGEPVQAVAVGTDELPANGLDYDGVGALALADPGSVLSPAQREALLAWIAGGGRLAVSSARPSGEGLIGSIGLGDRAGLGDGAGRSFIPFGLGGIVRMSDDISDEPGARDGDFWRPLLGLAPYGSAPRMGAAAVSEAAAFQSDAGSPDPVAAAARTDIVAALGAWFLVVLAASSFGHPATTRVGETRKWRTAPLVVASAVALAIAFASVGALDAAFMRGSSVRAFALVMPDSGAVFVSATIAKNVPPSGFSWLQIKATRPLGVAVADFENGRFKLGSGSWVHATAKADFSLASADSESLSLAAVLGQRSLAGSTLPYLASGSYPRDGTRPPELDSTGAMAFLSDSGQWWEKARAGTWRRSDDAPSWLKSEMNWLNALRGGIARSGAAKAMLVGLSAAPSLGLKIAGGSLRKLYWVLPIAGQTAERGSPPKEGA